MAPVHQRPLTFRRRFADVSPHESRVLEQGGQLVGGGSVRAPSCCRSPAFADLEAHMRAVAAELDRSR
jgi:hypothetical protein